MKQIPLLLTASLASITACSKEKPNIIYILADDLGYTELGVYGQKRIETPNIDNLARNGIRFTRHYCGSPVSAPSRCVLLTGRHSGHSFIRGNHEWGERGQVWNYAMAVEDPGLEGQYPIPDTIRTIAEYLHEAGYRTGLMGKWGLGAPFSEGAPNRQGFDAFFGYNCQRQAHTYYPPFLWKNEEKIWLENELVSPGTKLDPEADPLQWSSYAKFNQKEYSPDLMLEEAIKFIEASNGDPFFLYYASPLPHLALQAPKEWIDRYVEKFGDEEPYLGKEGYFPQRYPHAAYAAMVSFLDHQVGRLIEKLKVLGLYDNTLIIFSSDNGYAYNAGTDPAWFNPEAPFPTTYGYGKGFLHEAGIRVPMIACWPGRIRPGSVSDHLSCFYDVLPTICEIAGIPVPEGTDGISFLKALKGKRRQTAHPYLYWEFPEYGGQQAVRMGPWKGLIMDMQKGETGIRLYHLDRDLREEHDLAADHPEIVEQIRGIMEKEHQRPALPRFYLKPLDQE